MGQYNVVFRTLVGQSRGAITWSSFASKQQFGIWNDSKMQSWYEVVAEGVTDARAVELCSTPEAERAAEMYHLRQVAELTGQMGRAIVDIEDAFSDPDADPSEPDRRAAKAEVREAQVHLAVIEDTLSEAGIDVPPVR